MARFWKMHGCGNDFVVFDERPAPLGLTATRAAAIANRRTGVGCDQFIVIEPPPPNSNADAFMRIRNPDGAEAGACGNATRCVADLLARETGRRVHVIRTVAGNLPAEIQPDGRVRVDMGPARLDWAAIPLARAMDTLHLDLARGPLADPAAASMGNPHATFFVDDVERVDAAALGPSLEHDPLFPDRANIGFAHIQARGPDPAARVGTRRGADACLRFRGVRGAGERAPARADRAPRHRHDGRRRTGDRMARRRARADDRAGGDLVRRGNRSRRRIRHERRGAYVRLPAERLRERGDARPRGGAVGHDDRQHLRGDRRGRTPGAPVDPPHRARTSGCTHRRHRLRRADRSGGVGRTAWRGPGARQSRTSCGRKAGQPGAPGVVSDIMAARETAAHLVTEFAGRARAFVQVQQGCDHRCTFCIIPFGRGPNRSVPIGAVVAQVRALVAAGYQEVVLTGVDITSLRPGPAWRANTRATGTTAARAGARITATAVVITRPRGDRR